MVGTAEKEKTAEKILPEIGRNNRACMLDLLRGIAIIYVMLYHLLYDIIYFGGVYLPFFFTDAWEAVHQVFLALLFSVSGICAGFSKNVLKRGAELFLLGELITLGSAAFVPGNVIVFGVLSCFGMSMLIYGVTAPVLKKIPDMALLAVFAFLAILFWDFRYTDSLCLIFGRIPLDVPHDLPWLYPIGIISSGFYSADYFPLAPYGFVFLAGTALSDYVKSGAFPKFFYTAKLPVINFCGRHSLWFYIIHQPVFLAVTFLIFKGTL